MITHTFTELKETIYEETLSSGLRVFYCPKPNFHKTFVTLSTAFGAVHQSLGDYKTLPKGVAHFLEHKLFEYKKQDISKVFTEQSADINAYTQHNRTTVLFSCTDHLIKNIDLLLDITMHPEFSEDFIKKEQDIIVQEIKMYQDDSSTVAYMSLLKNLYHIHPVRHDILGTEASVRRINFDILKAAHEQFYHPSNMMLFVAGTMDLDELSAYLNKKDVKKGSFMPVYQPVIQEPHTIRKEKETIEFQLDIPQVLIGVKLKGVNDIEIMRHELMYSILFELLIGRSTDLFSSLVKQGLINDSFGLDFTLEEDYAYMTIGSETMKPNELETTLVEFLETVPNQSILESDFIRTKKQIIGGFIHALNSLEYIANQFTKYFFQGTSLFQILDVASTITYDDIIQLKEQFDTTDKLSIIRLTPSK